MSLPQIPVPILLPWTRSPSQTILLIRGARHCSCLFLGSGFQFPASPQNYSNKPITSSGINQKAPAFFILQACLPQPLVVNSAPEYTLCVLLWGCEYKLLSVSSASVQCCVLSHPHNPRVGIPPSSTR